MKISESFEDKDSLISEAHIRNMLALHWVEIKDTNIQYFAKESQLRATEKAVIALAKKLHPQQNQQERSSYIAISVLMPGHFSFSRRVNLEANVSIIDGCVFDYSTFADELITEGDEAVNALTPFNKYLAKFTLNQVKQLIKIFENVPEDLTAQQTQEFNKIKAALVALQKDFEFVALVKSCRNIEDGFSTPLKKVSSSYFFKTEDNIGFDLRSLFFTGYLNPYTMTPLSQTDLARAIKHPRLGLILKYYTENKIQDFFVTQCEIEVEEKYEIEIDVPILMPQASAETRLTPFATFTNKLKQLVHTNNAGAVNRTNEARTRKQKIPQTRKVKIPLPFDFFNKSQLKRLTDASPQSYTDQINDPISQLKLEQRQVIYFQLQNLIDLSTHFRHNNFIITVPPRCPLKEKMMNFEKIIHKFKENVIWTEMTNSEFFKRAALVVDDMQKIMGSEWNASTRNFFLAMKEFALEPDRVVSWSNSSYIKSNNEYLVRVAGLDTTKGAKKALKNLVDQFRGSFEIAYRYNRLKNLMSGMTPTGICIAEKMKHLCSMLAQVSSIASEVGDLHSVFAMMMAAATKAEAGPPAALWGGASFQSYLINKYAGKIKYLDEDGKTELVMTRTVINNYMIDVLMYDDISREGPAQPAP